MEQKSTDSTAETVIDFDEFCKGIKDDVPIPRQKGTNEGSKRANLVGFSHKRYAK